MTQEAILYYADHPADFVEDLLHVTPDKNQRAILDSVAKNQMTSVRSGHGIGKSAVEAWTVIWFMSTRPFPKIPCTAPTQHQLFDILWAEISKWLRNNKALERELMWTKEKVYMKQYPEEWFAVARTASKPDALQGFHADDILYIIDEASGVDDKVFEPVLGALSTPGARLLMCGNPTQLSGFFYDSHHKNRGSYTTFHVDGRNSSRVSDDFVKTIIQMYGEDQSDYRIKERNKTMKYNNKISAATIARTAALLLALTNQILSAFGKSPLPIESTTVEQLVTTGITTVTALINWWYNNSFTQAALEGDKTYENVKNQIH